MCFDAQLLVRRIDLQEESSEGGSLSPNGQLRMDLHLLLQEMTNPQTKWLLPLVCFPEAGAKLHVCQLASVHSHRCSARWSDLLRCTQPSARVVVQGCACKLLTQGAVPAPACSFGTHTKQVSQALLAWQLLAPSHFEP